MEVKIEIRLLGTDHFGKVLEAHLVSVLKLAVLISSLLDGIVR